MNRISVVCIQCMALLLSLAIGPAASPAHASGISDIQAQPTAKGAPDAPTVWFLGPPYDKNSLKGELTELISTPIPGSEECCGPVMAIFYGPMFYPGSKRGAIVASMPAPGISSVDEVARVSDTSYLAVAGSCEDGGCNVDVFGIDTVQHLLSRVFHLRSFGKGQAQAEACGWTIQYEGERYGLLAISQQPLPQATPGYFAAVRLAPEPQPCRR